MEKQKGTTRRVLCSSFTCRPNARHCPDARRAGTCQSPYLRAFFCGGTPRKSLQGASCVPEEGGNVDDYILQRLLGGDVSKSLRSTSGSTLSARRICIR